MGIDNMGCSGSDGSEKQEAPVHHEEEKHEEEKKRGHKIKNGDAVHLVSHTGDMKGKALHSNMKEGDPLSFGSLEHEELGWVLELDRTHKRKAIRAKDVVHLRPCGYGEGHNSEYYFHSNSLEGGGMSGGKRNSDCAWHIESEHKHVRDGDLVLMHAMAGGHDDKERGEYLHSNGTEGGGFSYGGDDCEYGWILKLIESWSTSNSDHGGRGSKVKNCSFIHLESNSGPLKGKVLHSNMAEGDAVSLGSPDHVELGWRIIADDDDAKHIRYGMDVQFQGMDSGTFMHCNAPEGKPYSGGKDNKDLGYTLEGGDDGDKIRYGDVVTLKCKAGPHDDSDRGPYMHSNAEEGAGFSFGGDAREHGWRFAENKGWSSASS